MPDLANNSDRMYETPQVTTVDARELLEALGPVCCYGPGMMPLPTQPEQPRWGNARS